MSEDEHDSPEEQPIEIWNIDGQATPVRMGPRLIMDARLAECRAQRAEAKLAEALADHKPSAREVLRLFAERQKTDRKLQLKAFCAKLRVNYASVRVAKSRIAKAKRRRKKR